MQYTIKKDEDGFLAEIIGNDSLYAFGFTEEEAIRELVNVIDMTMNYHSEIIRQGKYARNTIMKDYGNNLLTHAV